MVYSVKCFALQNGRCRMRGKDLTISILLDAYGALLTERQRELVDLYYNEDLSLAEISENTGITRQGVRDGIKKSESFFGSPPVLFAFSLYHAFSYRATCIFAKNKNCRLFVSIRKTDSFFNNIKYNSNFNLPEALQSFCRRRRIQA